MKFPQTDFVIAGAQANVRQLQFMCTALNPGPYRYFAYGGGIRGGKSYVVLFVLHQLCLRYPGSKWVVVRATLPDLKKTTIPSYKKLVNTKYYGTWHNTSPVTFTYHNGSQLMFIPESLATDPDLNAFLGLECNGFFLEQLEELSETMWQMAIQRAGSLYTQPMPPAYIFTTFNPNQHFGKQLFYEPYVNGTLQQPYYYMQALPKDNPHVTPDQWAAWQNMDERYRLQFINGDWTNFADTNNRWAFAFNYSQHTGQPEPDTTQVLYLSFDFNRNPICCSIIQHYNNTIHVLQTIKLHNSDIYELCNHIKTLYPGYTYLVTGDATGRNSSALVKDNVNYYQVIRKQLNLLPAQLKVPSVNPRLEDNQVLVNSLLSRYSICIHTEHAAALIYDLHNVRMHADGTIDKTNRANPTQQADALDTFRYFCNTFMAWFVQQG